MKPHTQDKLNPLLNHKIIALSKLAFADDNFNVDRTVQFLINRLENIVRKTKNTGYQHFLLFSQCFQKNSFQGCYPLMKQSHILRTPRYKYFENTLGKGENAGNQHFVISFSKIKQFHSVRTLRKMYFENIVEKEEMLGTSIFSFSHYVFCPFNG